MSRPHVALCLQTCPFTDAEMGWLWPRYQKCTFPPGSFPKRFARNLLPQLAEKGRTLAAQLAFQYRRQIFGKKAAKWSSSHFIEKVKLAARNQPTPSLKEIEPPPRGEPSLNPDDIPILKDDASDEADVTSEGDASDAHWFF